MQNNIRNSILENVRIEVRHSGETFEVSHIIPAKAIPTEATGECYVGIRKIADC